MDDNPYQASGFTDPEPVRPADDPPGFVAILHEATGILTQNFVLLSGIILTVWLPGNLFVNYMLYENGATDEFLLRAPMMIEGIFGPLYIGAMMFALSRIMEGERPSWSESIGHGFGCWGRLFGARFVAGILVMLGCLALLVPGIILAVRWALIAPAVVLEGLDANASRARSSELTEGYRWRIFGTAVVFYFVFILLSIALYLPTEVVPETDNMLVGTLLDCVTDLLTGVIQIAMFLYYWYSARAHEAMLEDAEFPEETE